MAGMLGCAWGREAEMERERQREREEDKGEREREQDILQVVSSSTRRSRRWWGSRPGSSTQVLASWRKKQRGFLHIAP
jgi:hypothetical protein